MQVKKGTHSKPFELWYEYSPSVKYFKVFGNKCYILKDFGNYKLNAKCEESIFFGYSTRIKAYECLNTNTNKVAKSANVKFDEYTEVHKAGPMKELEGYNFFVYCFEVMLDNEYSINQDANQQQFQWLPSHIQ